MNHTPTPWTIGRISTPGESLVQLGVPIAFDSRSIQLSTPDAEFIVRACNAHDAVVEALRNLRVSASAFRVFRDDVGQVLEEQVEAALKLAEGEEKARADQEKAYADGEKAKALPDDPDEAQGR